MPVQPDPDGQIDAVREVLGEIDAGAVPELLVFNKSDLEPGVAEGTRRRTIPGRLRSALPPVRASTCSCARSAIVSGRSPSSTNSSCPTTGATSSPRSTAKARWCPSATATDGLDDPGPAVRCVGRSAVGVPRRLRAGGAVVTSPSGFDPPPYPYDRLNRLKPIADAFAGGTVDLSIGTPFDPPPAARDRALGIERIAERSYPPSIGTPAYRAAAARWMQPALRRRCSDRADRGDDRHEGVRRDAPAVDEAADPVARHRAVSGDLVSDATRWGPPWRDAGRSRWPFVPTERLDLGVDRPMPTPTGRCCSG